MSSRSAKLKEELLSILMVALFFSTGFCLIHISARLFTVGSDVEIAGITKSVLGGLIVAKVLLLVDLLPFVDAFPGRPLVRNIVWKSWLYTLGAVLFLYLEPFVKSLFKGLGLYASHSHAWEELMRPRTWAILIFLAMLMVVFVTIKELSRIIGEEEMKHMFFRQRSQRPFRHAA